MLFQIQRIKPEQIAEAKRVILLVARGVYQWPEMLEQIIQRFDEQGKLRYIDDVQADIRSQRAIRFYQRLGFQPMDCVSDDPDDNCMEMAISAPENEKGA